MKVWIFAHLNSSNIYILRKSHMTWGGMLILGRVTLDFNSTPINDGHRTVLSLASCHRRRESRKARGRKWKPALQQRLAKQHTVSFFCNKNGPMDCKQVVQPVWKICSSHWIISPSTGENKKYWSHHPDCLRFEVKCWSLSTQSVDRVDGFHSRILQIQDYSRKNLQNPSFKQHPTYVFTKFQLPNPNKKLIFEKPLPLVALLQPTSIAATQLLHHSLRPPDSFLAL